MHLNQMKSILATAILLAFMTLLYIGLHQNPSAIKSPIMHQSMPHFKGLNVGDKSPFTDEDLIGKPYFLNIWATWCSSCAVEHPVWMQFSAHHKMNIVGVLYNDNLSTASPWLKQHGNPYTHLVNDPRGKLIINLGAYGTPETLFVDAKGVIQKRFIGPVTPAWINQTYEEFIL